MRERVEGSLTISLPSIYRVGTLDIALKLIDFSREFQDEPGNPFQDLDYRAKILNLCSSHVLSDRNSVGVLGLMTLVC